MTIIQKPIFNERVGTPTIIALPEFNLQFNDQRVGPTDFAGLRQADYGQNFRMPTMPELVRLIYASLENRRDYSSARNVVQKLREYWLTGNTGILFTQKGMYVKDNPEMKEGRIVMNEKKLEGKLGKTEVKGVTFSNDLSVRFTPYGFKRESQTASKLAKNSGVIAIAGGEEEAEIIAKSSEHYETNPYFRAFNEDSPQTKVAVLSSFIFADRLDVYAADEELDGGGCSFGVRELKAGEAK